MSEEQLNLLGGGELAELLGVSRERVRQLRVAGSLPEPIAVCGRRRLWQTEDIVQWCFDSGRAEAILERHSEKVLELRAAKGAA